MYWGYPKAFTPNKEENWDLDISSLGSRVAAATKILLSSNRIVSHALLSKDIESFNMLSCTESFKELCSFPLHFWGVWSKSFWEKLLRFRKYSLTTAASLGLSSCWTALPGLACYAEWKVNAKRECGQKSSQTDKHVTTKRSLCGSVKRTLLAIFRLDLTHPWKGRALGHWKMSSSTFLVNPQEASRAAMTGRQAGRAGSTWCPPVQADTLPPEVQIL